MEFNAEYIATLKRLRGVIFGLGLDDEKDTINWLSANFKYGTIGVAPSLWNTVQPRGSIIPLKWQFKEYELLCEELSRKSGAEISIVETIAMASMFCCVIIVISQRGVEKLSQLSLYSFLGVPPTDERLLKFYIKGCEDSVADSYSQNIDEARLVLSGSVEIGRAIRHRRSKSRQDAQKKFWRMGDGSVGQPIVLYLDLLSPAIQYLEKPSLFVPALSIVPALVIYKVSRAETQSRYRK